MKVVATNGCFDLLHAGHVSFLREARELGDYLIVGCNSDSSVKKLKGSTRPINNQEDRKAVLESIRWVDEVRIFEETDACNFLDSVKPNIYVKGGDYNIMWEKQCPVAAKERTIVESHGGSVKLLSFLEGKSTSTMIEKITGQLSLQYL
tara:strand:+ start:2694 stop:3140 length:447 start_codon:yes stop_codon:yes gene_type:complete